ncbi:carbohydrate ABC transporter permease [Galbitalea sp. SE-J8]|uniref:carbohydrate ABC transporter permease n=1 Tax=Galbitalea sp. SE-J8 TaxID=3054952 RepID=UPI00259CC2A7|nr:carbohydrate ABC transporter permease [Galbitalea sp. SE-J8]MDM4761664.1 carbohydrate ABC transporter permease [Galbitalea sp. SE-J8]
MTTTTSTIPIARNARHAVASDDRGTTPVGWIVGACVAASAIMLFLIPLLWTLSTSLKPYKDITAYPPTLLPTEITFQNYVTMWNTLDFPRLFLNTVVFAGGVTILALICDSLAAYALARLDFPGRNLVFVLILTTLMIPPQITLVPLFNLITHMGLLNTFPGLILPRAADAFGIFLLRQFFLSIPRDLEDAGRIDGASELRIFVRVILPLSKPAVLTLGLFIFMANWNDLLWPLIMSTDGSLATLPSGLASFVGQHVTEYGPLMAGSVLAMLPMFVAFLVVQRSFIQSIASTGIK